MKPNMLMILLLLQFYLTAALKHRRQLIMRIKAIPKEIESNLLESKLRYYMNEYLSNDHRLEFMKEMQSNLSESINRVSQTSNSTKPKKVMRLKKYVNVKQLF